MRPERNDSQIECGVRGEISKKAVEMRIIGAGRRNDGYRTFHAGKEGIGTGDDFTLVRRAKKGREWRG